MKKSLSTFLVAMIGMVTSSFAYNDLLGAAVKGALQFGERFVQESAQQGLEQFEVSSLYSDKQKTTTFDACADQFPRGKPLQMGQVPAQTKPMALCSDHFAVLYSQASKTPLVSIERLSRARIKDAKGEQRTNQFFADPRIPRSGRAELEDYRGSQYDRGHMAPAADSPDPRSMAQSFALSNMVPQNSVNNQKIWSKIESDVRKYATRASGNVFVYTGPLFLSKAGTIGRNKVWVPSHLFKLVYDEQQGRAWAYVLPNTETKIEPPMSYREFVSVSGLDLLNGLPVSN